MRGTHPLQTDLPRVWRRLHDDTGGPEVLPLRVPDRQALPRHRQGAARAVHGDDVEGNAKEGDDDDPVLRRRPVPQGGPEDGPASQSESK